MGLDFIFKLLFSAFSTNRASSKDLYFDKMALSVHAVARWGKIPLRKAGVNLYCFILYSSKAVGKVKERGRGALSLLPVSD